MANGGIHGEGGMCGKGGVHSKGGTCVVKGEACVAREGACKQERWPLKLVVCILLECILVTSRNEVGPR